MAYLDPNQQLAMASGQLQQQVQQPFAMPGAYNAPSYATQAERTATTLTQGVTNVALPGAALATSIGLGFVAPFAAPFRAGMAAGTLGRGFAGAGLLGKTAGTLMGGAAAGLSGIGIPMLAAQGISSAATRMVEGQREFLATRQLMRELPNTGSMFGSQSVLSPGGFGPSAISSNPYQIQSLQNSLSSIGSTYGASSGQMRNIVSQLAPMGGIDTSSIGAISRSLRQSMRELTSIAKMVGSDLDEATQVYSQLKQMGFGSMSSRTQALRQLTGSSALTGMSLGDVTGLASGVVAAATAAGLGTSAGMNIATNALASASVRHQAGAIDPMYMQRVGGIQGYAARMSEIQLGMLGSEGAASAMSHMFNASGDLRAGGFSDAVSGRRARRSFFREYDPYRMGAMQQRFSRSSRALILGRVSGIQNEYSGAEANRRQYEFLSGFGITDPTEQLEYLSMLRSQPRAQAMQTAQMLRNQMTTSVGGAGLANAPSVADRLTEGLNRVTQSLTGTGQALERFGATLQQQSESLVNRINTSIMGSAPTSARTGMYTAEAMDLTLQSIAAGEATFGYTDPLQRLRHRLNTDASFRGALGQSTSISGGTGAAVGGVNRMLYAMGAPILTGGAQSLYRQFGSTVGATATSATGTFVGTNDAGERMYANADEFIRMRMMSFGGNIDSTTGSAVSASQSSVDEVLFSQGHQIRMLGNRLTYGRERTVSSGRGGDVRVGGFSPSGMAPRGRREMRRLVREGGTYQLTSGQLEQVRQDRETYIEQYGQAVGLNPSVPGERALLLEAMRQSGDAIAAAAAGEGGGVSASQLLAASSEEAARSSFGAALGELSDAFNTLSLEEANNALLDAGRYDLRSDVPDALRGRVGATGDPLTRVGPDVVPGRAGEIIANTISRDESGRRRAVNLFSSQLNRMADAGNAMGAAGAAVGALAGSRDFSRTVGNQGFAELMNFVQTGGGGFGDLSGSSLPLALQTYVSTATQGADASDVVARLNSLLSGVADDGSAQGRRARQVLEALIGAEGNLNRPDRDLVSQPLMSAVNALDADQRDSILGKLTASIPLIRDALGDAGQSIIEARSQESIQQIAQNVLQSGDVMQALRGSRKTFRVGDREVSMSDVEDLSPAEALELLNNPGFRDELERMQEHGTEGEKEAAARALASIDPLTAGDGSASGRLETIINRALTGGITDEELSELSGVTTQGNLRLLQSAMGEGGSAEDLFAALGGERNALTVLKRLGADTDNDGSVSTGEVENFLQQVQSNGLSGSQVTTLSTILGAASMLGEDAKQQQEDRDFRQLQDRVFRGLERALTVDAAGETALAVFARPTAGDEPPSNADQDNAGTYGGYSS